MYLGGPVRQPDTRAKGEAVDGGKMVGGGEELRAYLSRVRTILLQNTQVVYRH
jgi:hypothetical protein